MQKAKEEMEKKVAEEGKPLPMDRRFGDLASCVRDFKAGRISRAALFDAMPGEYRRIVMGSDARGKVTSNSKVPSNFAAADKLGKDTSDLGIKKGTMLINDIEMDELD